MERIYLCKVIEWYNKKENRKPLVIWGARQIGKTYLIKEMFANNYLKDYVYIDLRKDQAAASYFKSTSDDEKYLLFIESNYGKTISNDCPLIIDEAQVVPNVMTSLKYFNQDHPELPIIVTGSMVRLSLQRYAHDEDHTFLFPVGKINSLLMYPINFEEYLLNANKSLLERIKEAYFDNKRLEKYEHELAMDLLHEFLCIGGLPEVVKTFLFDHSYVKAKETLTELYDNYIADMALYNISDEMVLKTRKIYKNIFSQLNKENKNFKIAAIERGKSNRDYFGAYEWLDLAHVIYRSQRKEGKVTSPLLEEEGGLFRLYLSDPGLFVAESKTPQSNFISKDARNELSGVFYESYVADEFVSKGIPLYYWTGKQQHEFEFIVDINGEISPIDVKKGKGKLNSLKDFREHNKKTTAIKISSNEFGYDKENDILTVPLYMTFLLAKDIVNGKLPKFDGNDQA